MNNVEKVKSFFKEESRLFTIVKVVLILLAVYLLSLTWNVWTNLLKTAFTALKPFIYGFVIAYILNPLVNFMEDKGIKKPIAITLILIFIIAIFILIVVTLFPMFYEEFTIFLNSINNSITHIVNWYTENAQDTSGILASMINGLESNFTAIQNSALDFMRTFITNIISASFNVLTTSLFTITITLYMLSDFAKFKDTVKRLSLKISPNFPSYLEAIDLDMEMYVRSTLLLMLVYFVEYTAIYFIMGHKAYLMIGLLYVVIGTLVPYVGGMIVTVIGILTGLTLPLTNLLVLIVLVMLASQVDGYVTSPMIYKKGVKVEPLASLLIVFFGSAVFGVIGVMLAMPIYVSLRAVSNVKKNRDLKTESLEEDFSEEII